MMNTKKLLAPKLLTIALASAFGGHAWANDWKESAKTALSEMVSGKAPKQVPVSQTPARSDSWGDGAIMPRRGRASEGTSPAQMVDERGVDDRYGVKDEGAEGTRKTSKTKSSSRDAKESGRSAKASRNDDDGGLGDVEMTARNAAAAKNVASRARAGRASDAAAVAGAASCTNVSRAWDGAANFADLGQTDRAYSSYVRLLSSCKTEREILGTVYQAIRHLPSESLFTLLDEPVMGSIALQDAAYELKSNLLFRFNKDKKSTEALKMADDIRESAILRGDSTVLTVTGYLELAAKRIEKSQNTFRAALKADRENDKAREGLALVLLAAGKPDAAWREADRLSGVSGDNVKGTVRIAQARQAYDNDEPKDALRHLNDAEKYGFELGEAELALKAWSLKQTGQADKSSRIFAQLNRTAPNNKEYASGLIESYRSAGEFDKIERLTESVTVIGPMAQTVIADQYVAQGRLEEAAAIRGEPVEGGAPLVGGLFGVKTKSGEAGAGRLSVTSIPEVAFSTPVGTIGRLVANVGSLRLSDGVNDVTAREARVGFTTRGQTVLSVGLMMSTVLGDKSVGGDLAIRRYNAGGYNELSISRGPIYDSVRSYAGVLGSDGFFTGRVNQVSFTFAGNQTINADWKADYSLSMGSVTGRNVNNNGFFRTTLAGIRNMSDIGMQWLSAGPQMHLAGYKEDQNLFVRPAGGYFSPKSDTGFGVKAFVASDTSSRLVLRGSAYAGYVTRSFVDFTESGLQLEGDVAASYLFNENMIATVGTTLRTSPGYNDAAFWVSLTVPFEKRSTLNSRDIIRPTMGIR